MTSAQPDRSDDRRSRVVLAAAACALFVAAGIAAAGVANPPHEVLQEGARLAVVLLCSVAGLALTAWLVLRPSRHRPRALGWFSGAVSLLCLSATVFVWIAVATDDALKGAPGTVVSTPAETGAYLTSEGRGSLQRIPTGVWLQTSQFVDANTVKVTGYLWQRLPASADATTAAVELPDAVDSGALHQVYRQVDGGTQTVGWRLATTLRESFDYAHYPLDRQVVWLSMWPRTPGSVLVPDFASFPPWHADAQLGLYPELVTGGWRTHFTTFSMGEVSDRTTYGRSDISLNASRPELHFSVGVVRDFLSPLLDRLVPLIVIAALVFASLFVVTTDADRRTLAGFSTWTVIGFCGAMMLVVAVQHSSLRSATGSVGVAYAEYFYFILYLVIALVALNVVEYTSSKRVGLLAWRGNLAARLLYWPVLTTLLLTATVAAFLL